MSFDSTVEILYCSADALEFRSKHIIAQESATLFSLFSLSDVSSVSCLNSKDFPLFVLSQAITHATISSLWRVASLLELTL